ncbi:MAG: hypothetical protein HQL69_17650 [Magnetococcales bacterium]|nr:hypothetical protein [Magnetococcales bacterium]
MTTTTHDHYSHQPTRKASTLLESAWETIVDVVPPIIFVAWVIYMLVTVPY